MCFQISVPLLSTLKLVIVLFYLQINKVFKLICIRENPCFWFYSCLCLFWFTSQFEKHNLLRFTIKNFECYYYYWRVNFQQDLIQSTIPRSLSFTDQFAYKYLTGLSSKWKAPRSTLTMQLKEVLWKNFRLNH